MADGSLAASQRNKRSRNGVIQQVPINEHPIEDATARRCPTHVPCFKCPRCDCLFLDSVESLFSHFDTSHNGRQSLIGTLNPQLLERIFAIVHHSFVSSSRSAYSSTDTKEYAFPTDEGRWKEWFVSCFAGFAQSQLGLVATTQPGPSTSTHSVPLAVPPVARPPGITVGDEIRIQMQKQMEIPMERTTLPAPAEDPLEQNMSDSLKREIRLRRLDAAARRKPDRSSIAQLLNRTCRDCDIVFENRCQYTRHLLDHKKQMFMCKSPGCTSAFESLQKLHSHISRAHTFTRQNNTAVDTTDSVVENTLAPEVKPEPNGDEVRLFDVVNDKVKMEVIED